MAFRRDEFVKTVQGTAVPGAQVWVCNQPANVAGTPPSPLANISSDVNGLVPITQPILTDGFGHAFFYTAAGIYTIVVSIGGVIQQVYPDQLIGNNGVGSISLLTNGILNIDQAALNLESGSFISITSDGIGGVLIDTTTPIPSAIDLQTNGVDNSDQALLNLHSSDASITLTADGVGGVDIQTGGAGVGVASIQGTVGILSQSAHGPNDNGNNLIETLTFNVFTSTKFKSISLLCNVGGTDTNLFDVGIYNTIGTRLAHIGPTVNNTVSSGVVSFNTLEGEITIPAGQYIFAMTGNTGIPPSFEIASPSAIGNWWKSATVTVGGTLPTTAVMVAVFGDGQTVNVFPGFGAYPIIFLGD